jgi:hypothetical protein
MSLKSGDGREGAGAIVQIADNFRAEVNGVKDATFEVVRHLNKVGQKASSDALPNLLLKLDDSADQFPAMAQQDNAKGEDNFGAPKGPRGFANERFGEQVSKTVETMREVAVAAAAPSESRMENIEQAAPQQAQNKEFDLILV